MCERKPGPRCSSDTLTAFRAAKSEFTEVKKTYDAGMAESKLTGVPYLYESSGLHKVVNAERKQDKANLMYDASPGGLKSLEQLASVSGNSVVTETQGLQSSYSLGEESEPKTVSVRVPRKSYLKNRKLAAGFHREWQSRASQLLANAEKESSAKALFIAGQLRKELEGNKILHNAAAFVKENEIQEKIQAYSETGSEVDEQKVAHSLIFLHKNSLSTRYNEIKLADLTSYEKTLKENSNLIRSVDL